MRDVLATEELKIPEGVTVTVKSLIISVTGPRGSLTKNVRHCNMDIVVNKDTVLLKVWQGHRKQIAGLRTIRSLINNMIIGVTKVSIPHFSFWRSWGWNRRLMRIYLQGFQYKLRAVFAHFPINMIIQDSGKSVEIRNFLGEKAARHVNMLEGVTIAESKGTNKDEFLLEGIDVQAVSQSGA